MTDNLTTTTTVSTIPSGTVIATDDAGAGGHVQLVKLAISTDGAATALTADNTDGLLVNLGTNNDVTLATLPDTAAGDLAAINSAVNGTLTVGSHAVTNAGTFAVQAAQSGTWTVDLGTNNDVTIDGSTVIKAEDAAHVTGDTGIQALAVRSDTLAALAGTTGDYTPLQVNASGALYIQEGSALTVDGSAVTQPVSAVSLPLPSGASTAANQSTANTALSAIQTAVEGTLTVGSHAVTNAGTFATQESGSLLTAAQLIDDIVYVDDADWTDTTSKHALVGGLYQSVPQTITDGDVGPLQVNSNGQLIVDLGANNDVTVTGTVTVDASGATVPVSNAGLTELAAAINASQLDVNIATDSVGIGGGTQYTEGGTDATITGTAVMWEDAADTLRAVSAAKPFPVEIITGGGTGGTAETDDAAFTAASGSGTPIMGFATSDVVDAGDVGVLAMDTSRNLKVSIEVDNVGIGGGTQYAVDTALGATPTGTLAVGIRDDALSALTPIEGDAVGLRVDGTGALWITTDDTIATSLATLPDTASGDLAAINTAVSGTLTVGSHAVTNAGTFAVQEDGAALTALQVIDNPVLVDDAAFTPATSSVMMAGFEFDDVTPDSVNEGDAGAARMSANRNIYIQIRDAAGNERGANINASNELLVKATDSDALLTTIDADTSTLAGAVSAGQMQVDLVSDGAGLLTTTAHDAAFGTAGSADAQVRSVQGIASMTPLLVDATGQGDVPITLAGETVTLAAGTNTNEVVGDVAHDAAAAGNPVLVAGSHETMADSAPANRVTADADASRVSVTDGAIYAIPTGPQIWSYHSNGSTALTDATVHAAPGANLALYVTDIVFSSGAATAINAFFEEATTTVLGPYYLEATAGRGAVIRFQTPKKITANTALTVTTSAAIAHSVDVTGFIAPG